MEFVVLAAVAAVVAIAGIRLGILLAPRLDRFLEEDDDPEAPGVSDAPGATVGPGTVTTADTGTASEAVDQRTEAELGDE